MKVFVGWPRPTLEYLGLSASCSSWPQLPANARPMRQQVMAQVIGPLPPMWEVWIGLLAHSLA